MLMYAEAGGVDSMTFPVINTPLLSFRYRQCTHALSRRPRDPPRIMDVLRDAQWRTNTPGRFGFCYCCFFLNQHFNLLKCKTEKPPRASRPSLRTNYQKKRGRGEVAE